MAGEAEFCNLLIIYLYVCFSLHMDPLTAHILSILGNCWTIMRV